MPKLNYSKIYIIIILDRFCLKKLTIVHMILFMILIVAIISSKLHKKTEILNYFLQLGFFLQKITILIKINDNRF